MAGSYLKTVVYNEGLCSVELFEHAYHLQIRLVGSEHRLKTLIYADSTAALSIRICRQHYNMQCHIIQLYRSSTINLIGIHAWCNTPEKRNLRCIQITNSQSFTGNYTEQTRIQMRYKSLPVEQCKQHRMRCWKPRCRANEGTK